MLPVRRDVAEEVQELNQVPSRQWMAEVFETAQRQYDAGVEEVPPDLPTWTFVQDLWLDAWEEIVVDGNYSPHGPAGTVDREHIKRVLGRYGGKIRKLAH